MTREEYTDFLQFLFRKRLIDASAMGAMIAKCDATMAMQNYRTDHGAKLILTDLVRNNAFTSTTHPDYLVAEWQSSIERTGARPISGRLQVTLAAAPPSAMTKVASPSPDAQPSKIGPYHIINKLGQGAMGAVYLGQHKDLGLRVAIKVILGAVDPEVVERFRREAKTVIGLSHPNLVRGYSVDIDHNPRYIAIEFVEGDDFDKGIGKYDVYEKIAKLRDVCLGVQAMHDKGLVHRDLKPANIRLDVNGRVVVMDPGMVKSVAGKDVERVARALASDSSPELTEAGTIIGTPMYMAPEQVDERAPITPATDVYALGKIIFYTLTGQSVHLGKNMMDLLQQVVAPELPKHVTAALREFFTDEAEYEAMVQMVTKSLDGQPGNRHHSAGELGVDLGNFLQLRVQREREARERERAELEASKARLRKLAYVGIAGCVLLIFSLLSTIFFIQARNAERKAAEAAQARAEAEGKAAQEAETARDIESRKAEVARKLVVAQAFMSAADWRNAKRELREILSIDETSYTARWLLAEASYNSFDSDYLTQYRWLAEHASDPSEKARAQFWVVFAGLDQGGITVEEAPALIAAIQSGLYRDLAELYFAGHESSRFTGLANIARRDRNEAQAGEHERTAREWVRKAEEIIDRLDPKHWLVAFVHGFISREDRTLARERLTYALSHNPNLAMAYYWRAAAVHEDTEHPQPISAVHDAERLHVLMPGWPRGELMRGSCYLSMAQYWEREAGLVTDSQQRERLIDESVRWANRAVQVVEEYPSWNGADVYEKHADNIEGHWAYFLYHKARILKAANRHAPADQARQQALAAIDRLRARRQRGPLAPQMENLFQLLPQALERLR